MNNFCPNCGHKVAEDSQFCMNCGFSLGKQNQTNINTVGVNNNVQPTSSGYSNGMGIAGFVISLVSIIMCCGSLSWLSIIFSIIGMNNAKKSNGTGYGLSLAGLIISIVGLLIFLFYFSAFIAGFMEGITA